VFSISRRGKKGKKKNIPNLGPNNLFFCFNCSLPIIQKYICPVCGKKLNKVPLTPPYDVRPATKREIKEIQELIRENFGVSEVFFTEHDIIMLNHIGSEDQMDEIIFYGIIIGSRRYDLQKNSWVLKLNQYGLLLIEEKITKNWVVIDDGAKRYILDGANVLIPGVISADPEIKEGEYIAILDKERRVIAGGITKIDEEKRTSMNRGVYAKNYKSITNRSVPTFEKRRWEDVIKANEKILEEITEEAIKFIRKTKKELRLPVAVSFSGGKDSLVTLDLAKKALPEEKMKVFFVDTGIEFPETVAYVKGVREELGLEEEFYIEKVEPRLFWEAFEKFGPPGRDYRYCCKFAKLAPIRKLILENFPEGKCISLIGQRRYESYSRSTTDIWQNQYIPNQINVSPIQNWTALMIWLYIFWQKLPYNPLYDLGYERIGCWVCPSSNMSQFKLLKKSNIELHRKLFSELEKWRIERNLPDVYISMGLWRFKTIPQKIANILLLDKSELKELQQKTEKLGLRALTAESSDCKNQPMTIIGSFSKSLDLEKVKNALPLVGKIQYNKKINFVRSYKQRYSIILYKDGTFKARFEKQENPTRGYSQKIIEQFVYSVLRAEECLGCRLCEDECKKNAITISNKELIVDEEKCIQCKECFTVCPICTIAYRNEWKKIKRITTEQQ